MEFFLLLRRGEAAIDADDIAAEVESNAMLGAGAKEYGSSQDGSSQDEASERVEP